MLRANLRILRGALERAGDVGLDWEMALGQLQDISFSLDESLIVAITDARGEITFANRKFCEISQYSTNELLGEDHRVINSGYHSKAFFREMWRTIAHGQVWRGEVRNRAKDGTIYWMDTTIVPCLNEKGKPYQYVSFRNDITKRKIAEEALRRSEKAATAGQIASSLVHEIRNPLAAMKWALQVLRLDVPERTKDFDAILSELDRIDGIVEELLTLAKPHVGAMEVVHVLDILNIPVNMMRPQAKRKHIDLQLTIDNDVPLIRCEPNKLKQVFINFIKNAIEAMSKGGIITIHASRSLNDRLSVEVIDQGCGMPEEVITRLGDPFVSTKKQGTGLGMMVCYQIIHSHDGEIDIQSQLGEGTTIRTSLPGVLQTAAGL